MEEAECIVMMYDVYAIVSRSDKRAYIGMAKDFRDRITAHKNMLKTKTHTNEFLQADWNSGIRFDAEIIETVEGKEWFYIWTWAGGVYNITKGMPETRDFKNVLMMRDWIKEYNLPYNKR